jgi:hypothetical protein
MGSVAIIGAGPYGLSIAAHLAACNVEHRIFGRPMQFWSRITDAGGERYLKSFCFGTNISSPVTGSSFNDYSTPRGLETFEPCSMGQFTAYGLWFQQRNVPWVEPVNVSLVERQGDAFAVTLENGDRMNAANVVVATGLDYFDHLPQALAPLPPNLATHTSKIMRFAEFKGRDVLYLAPGNPLSKQPRCSMRRELGRSFWSVRRLFFGTPGILTSVVYGSECALRCLDLVWALKHGRLRICPAQPIACRPAGGLVS